MKQKALLIIVVLFVGLTQAQNYSALWQGYYSYLNIKDTSRSENKIYAAAENAVFTYDVNTFEIEKISSIQGLSGEIISTIHYSQDYGMLLIGYENGLIEIVIDGEEDVLTIVDILDKPTIPPTSKKINHFNEYNGQVYIAADFGISVYDLSRLEFGDTYYIGPGGSQIQVKQTTVRDDYIFAACYDGVGLKRALVASDNLIDYQQWQSLATGNFVGVQEHMGAVFAIRANRRVYNVVGNALTELAQLNHMVLDLKSNDDYLVITTANDVYAYDVDFNVIAQATFNEEVETSFTAASVHSGFLYIGTQHNGVLKTALTDGVSFEQLHPDGPLLNNTFAIEAYSNNLWVTYGDYTLTYNPSPLRSRGVSHLRNETWANIPYDSLLSARNLNKIVINPFNEDQVFISSFNDGLLEINNNVPTVLYNETNSGLESLIIPTNPNIKSIRQSASKFDSNGVLWTMTGRVARPLKSYDPTTGQWQGYDFTSLIPDALGGEWGYSDLDISSNGTKWIGGYNYGLIGFNNTNGVQLKNLSTEEGNMSNNFVTSLAVDKNDRVWVGTISGLRVLYNSTGFFTDNVQVEEIVILENGQPSELLYQQFVSDIEVDGANNKWIGVMGAGLFYFSSDGQETIFHFTKDNSPLPSNNIIDVSIDASNGRVYIATDKGLLSYGSGSSGTKEDFEDAFVYPNPVRPDFNMVEKKIKIRGLPENVNIKITDIEGNLVAEAQSNVNMRYKGYHLEIDGGSAFWNGKNLANNTVASGVYLIMLTDLDALETKVLKLMVVR
ncbi:ABC transporter substrate-binding protein [Mangrovimonas yunxiaonensis]|uniref:ABC transporter substrate-binding protein n=2 Tax=Mangrovimonas yunxiaonensis TaxID=1197477 RepID=A0A084TL13_9FLAO|nr:ABC transporter substrate-binding protein [Mangrovimonas yunxiaonensis]